jgi:hypothetical protein
MRASLRAMRLHFSYFPEPEHILVLVYWYCGIGIGIYAASFLLHTDTRKKLTLDIADRCSTGSRLV